MKIRASIFTKILLVILPLVGVPIVIVGYFSVKAAEDRVDRLVRQEQMLLLEAVAKRINDVLSTCKIDLETISGLPILEDYHLARSFRLEAEAEFNYENIVRIFRDFIYRTPYYREISCLDVNGRELIKVVARGAGRDLLNREKEDFFQKTRALESGDMYFSDVILPPDGQGLIIQASMPFFSGYREMAGIILIELDFEKIHEMVKSIRVGESGYAFLMDPLGRVIVHPRYKLYDLNQDTIEDQSLRELSRDMMAGGSGWMTYTFEDLEKVAAFAPIPALNWSLAVTIPSQEFRKEAQAIRDKIIQVAALVVILTVTAVSLLSYNLLRPVRRLVNATQRIARGDLDFEVPVRSGDELGELTTAFNRMVKNLARTRNELVRSEKLVSLGRLSAGVAHEIRNPLNAMKAAIVYLQRRRAEDPLIAEYTGLVSEEIDRLNRFVTEFLYFAKQAPPRTQLTDLNKLILSVENLFEEQAKKNSIVFINRLDSDLPLIMVDAHQMEQVLINLVVNAMEAMPGGGSVTVSTIWLSSRDQARIMIHDNGHGISSRHLQNIFDPFFTTKETGTGLGLTLSLGIVESHGGTINLKSQPGQGATVYVELPLTREQKTEDG